MNDPEIKRLTTREDLALARKAGENALAASYGVDEDLVPGPAVLGNDSPESRHPSRDAHGRPFVTPDMTTNLDRDI